MEIVQSRANMRLLTLLLLTPVLLILLVSCEKETEKPLTISETATAASIRLTPSEELDEISFLFEQQGETYYVRAARAVVASEANGRMEVANTQLLAPDVQLEVAFDAVDANGRPYIFRVGTANTGTRFSITINAFVDIPGRDNVRRFNQISLGLDNNSDVSVQGFDGRFVTAYQNNAAGLSQLTQRILDRINDDQPNAAGAQPLPMDIRVEKR